MQCKSFFQGCCPPNLSLDGSGNFWHSNGLERPVWNGRYYDGFPSSTCSDVHLGHYKEILRQTMLKHEAIFEAQNQELHRLYWRQKELELEMKEMALYNYHARPGTLHPNSFLSRSSAEHVPCHDAPLSWMKNSSASSIVNLKGSSSPLGYAQGSGACSGQDLRIEALLKDAESTVKDCKKCGKRILDLELPAYEYDESEEERSLEGGKAHEVPRLPAKPLEKGVGFVGENEKESSLGSTNLDLDMNSKTLARDADSSGPRFFVDLNKPINIEDAADSNFGDSHLFGRTYPEKDNGQQELIHNDCEAGTGIDLNSSPPASDAEEACDVKLLQDALPVPPSEKHDQERPMSVVQALPCFSVSALAEKGVKPSYRHLRKINGAARKRKVLGKDGYKLDLIAHMDVDDSSQLLPLQAPVSPENKESSRPSAASEINQPSVETEKSSPRTVDSHQNQTCLESKEQLSSSSIPETQTVQDEQARIAAEILVCISFSKEVEDSPFKVAKPHGDLLWFADVATSSSVPDCSKREFGISLDDFEAMTLKLVDVNVEEQYCIKSTNASKPEIITAITSVRSKPRRGRQKRKDFQREILPSLAALSRNEVSEDLQMIGGLMEATGGQWEGVVTRNSLKNGRLRGRKRSCGGSPPLKVTETTQVHDEERRTVPWGTVTKRRRSPRGCGGSFQIFSPGIQ